MVFDETSGTWYPALKVRRLKNAVIGAAGDAGDCIRMLDWAEGGFNEKKRPKFTQPSDSDSSVVLLLLNSDGIHVMSQTDPHPEKVADATYAVGSGGKAAWAALQCGKTLLEAMEMAHSVDPYTRPPFDILALEEGGTEK